MLHMLVRMSTWSRQLLYNARLVHQVLQVVQHGGGVPDVVALPQQLQLIPTAGTQSASELLEALILVDELVYHVPQPSVWQLQAQRLTLSRLQVCNRTRVSSRKG